MRQQNKIQTAIILTILALTVWVKFNNPYQSLLLELTSDTTLVVMLLGFSEVLISSLILFPIYFAAKAFQFLKTQSSNQ